MAQVKVEQPITIRANDVGTVHYPAGFSGRVPKDHAERIAAAGAGTHLDAAEADASRAGEAGDDDA
ncbi:hypothetical protein ASF27_01700 [Methylobacterium sp. Leaf102]|uniref:hypothetical protein n=1 Tax=Methylobacterium sp. Leaf102 TaxID=1736253 RepID=UPI0006F3EAD6|nr:hypothetical protein [Methylobacterium sp. Leaf102]KQP34301.1 hypothetical protein ASF27_01700 [Methylobacterium sp. Leaf102]